MVKQTTFTRDTPECDISYLIILQSLNSIHRSSQTLWPSSRMGGASSHACNPSYSGGRGQEDHGSKPTWANSSRDPISKNPSQK
jgi:hypothetical protein